jgi:hypothetical protein
MATTLNAGTTAATALNVITDTTGAMAIQTSGTTAIAISNAQVVSLTNALLPASGGTGITSLGTGVATALGQNVTGSGSVVLGTSPSVASPTLTGTPVAPTATAGTNTTQIATTAFVGTAVSTATGALGTMSTQNANNVSITGGTITGITDLTVADGGTGSSSLTANSVILGNGTAALSGNMVAPSTAGKVLASNGTTWVSTTIATSGAKLGLGITGEVWNDVTGSRAFNTSYTNSNAYPIAVSARTTCSTGSAIAFIVNGVTISNFNWQFNGCGSFGGGFVIVPPGQTYQLNSGQGVDFWRELY